MSFLPAAASLDDLTGVWKALADPTRRAILDLLRQRPHTTGQLAEGFALTRFGVMKHLGVLVEAGLVLVRRRGRERWNHLNAVPIQRIYDRWMRPFEVASAERLLRLKRVAEVPPEEIAMTQGTDRAFRTVDIQQELRINAPRATVWQALTRDIGRWWPAKFYVGKAPVRFALEPQVGGRVFEDWGDGEGSLWGTVATVRVGELLQWTADLPADYGGPARNMTTFRLNDDGEGTRLQFRDTLFGELSEEFGEQLTQGWGFLLRQCLQPWAETGRQPERPETVVAHERAGGR